MRRREFLAVFGAGAVPITTGGVVMEAVIAPRLPSHVVVDARSLTVAVQFIELREYTKPSHRFMPGLERILRRAGGEFAATESTVTLRFDSLAERERFWNAVNADPAWARLRREFDSYRFAVYRPARA